MKTFYKRIIEITNICVSDSDSNSDCDCEFCFPNIN